MVTRMPNGQLIAGVLCIIDENPHPNAAFGAPAVSIGQLASALNVPAEAVAPVQVVEAIRPLSDSLFDVPRQPTLRQLNVQGRLEDWIVFESVDQPRRGLTRPPSPARHPDPLVQPAVLALPENTRRDTRRYEDGDLQSNRSFSVLGSDLLRPPSDSPTRIPLPVSGTPSPNPLPTPVTSTRAQGPSPEYSSRPSKPKVRSSASDPANQRPTPTNGASVRFPRPRLLLPMPRPRPYRPPTLDSPLASAPLGPSRSLTLEPVSPDLSYVAQPKSASVSARGLFGKFRPPWKTKSAPSSPTERESSRIDPRHEIEAKILHRKLMDQQNSYFPENLIMATADRLTPALPQAETSRKPPRRQDTLASESPDESEEVDLIESYSESRDLDFSDIEREVQDVRTVRTRTAGPVAPTREAEMHEERLENVRKGTRRQKQHKPDVRDRTDHQEAFEFDTTVDERGPPENENVQAPEREAEKADHPPSVPGSGHPAGIRLTTDDRTEGGKGKVDDQDGKLQVDVDTEYNEEDESSDGNLSPWEIDSESDRDFDYYTEDGGETPPPTPFLAKALEDLPFAPRRGFTASSLVTWVSTRWQVLAAELVAVVGLAYIVQASGF